MPQLGSSDRSLGLHSVHGSMQPLLSSPRAPENKIQDSTVFSPKATPLASPGITVGVIYCVMFVRPEMVLIAYLLSTARITGQGHVVKPWVVLGEKHYRAIMSEMPLSLNFPISGGCLFRSAILGRPELCCSEPLSARGRCSARSLDLNNRPSPPTPTHRHSGTNQRFRKTQLPHEGFSSAYGQWECKYG